MRFNKIKYNIIRVEFSKNKNNIKRLPEAIQAICPRYVRYFCIVTVNMNKIIIISKYKI